MIQYCIQKLGLARGTHRIQHVLLCTPGAGAGGAGAAFGGPFGRGRGSHLSLGGFGLSGFVGWTGLDGGVEVVGVGGEGYHQHTY